MTKRALTPFGWILCVSTAFAAAGGGYVYFAEPEITTSDPENLTASQNAEKPSSKEQETGTLFKEMNGVKYKLWEGLVVEEQDNLQGTVTISYDANIYDFDLGIIYHSSRSDSGIARTLFNELRDQNGALPKHIDDVRKVGCEIAQEYIRRGNDKERYNPAPEDVQAYFSNHCTME